MTKRALSVTMTLSSPAHKYDDVLRTARRPSRKARGGRIPLSYLTDEQRSGWGCIAVRIPSYLRAGLLSLLCLLLPAGSFADMSVFPPEWGESLITPFRGARIIETSPVEKKKYSGAKQVLPTSSSCFSNFLVSLVPPTHWHS